MKKSRKGKGKGKGKGKSKHGVPIASRRPDLPQAITPSVAEHTQRDDPSAISPLPGHGSSPRGGDQAPARPLYTDVVRRRQQPRQHALQPPMQPQLPQQQAVQPPVQSPEMQGSSSEDHDDYSPDNSTEDNDDSTLDCYSEDHDDLSVRKQHNVMSGNLTSSSSSDDMVSPSTISTLQDYDRVQPARHTGFIIPSTKSISATLVNKHNTPPHDAARKEQLPTQKQTLQPPVQPKEITTASDDIEHSNTPPPDPCQAKTYADVVKQASTPPTTNHATTRSRGSTSAHYIPSAKSLDILDYSSKDHDDHFSLIKLEASKKIQIGADFDKEEAKKIEEICKPHVGSIASVLNLGGFMKKHPLMGRVKIFRGRMTILLATAQGRLLAQTMVAAIRECHLHKRSWNGTFDIEHILIIVPRISDEFMMILKDPVEFEGKALLQAKANDLGKAAEILKTLYMVGDDYAVYFDEFIQDLREATSELLADEQAFMEYLTYHPSIILSTGRSTFVSRLSSSIREAPVMLSKTPYPYDWKTIVESEIYGKIKAQDINNDKNKEDTDIIVVLNTVYYHKNKYSRNDHNDNYENTVRGLMRFMRNVLHHGKEHDVRVIHGYELELYLSKMFSRFLPSTLRAMLMSRRMEELYGEDWSSYKTSKRNKWEPVWSELITMEEEYVPNCIKFSSFSNIC